MPDLSIEEKREVYRKFLMSQYTKGDLANQLSKYQKEKFIEEFYIFIGSHRIDHK